MSHSRLGASLTALAGGAAATGTSEQAAAPVVTILGTRDELVLGRFVVRVAR